MRSCRPVDDIVRNDAAPGTPNNGARSISVKQRTVSLGRWTPGNGMGQGEKHVY